MNSDFLLEFDEIQDIFEPSPWQQGSTLILQTTHCSWPWTKRVWYDRLQYGHNFLFERVKELLRGSKFPSWNFIKKSLNFFQPNAIPNDFLYKSDTKSNLECDFKYKRFIIWGKTPKQY